MERWNVDDTAQKIECEERDGKCKRKEEEIRGFVLEVQSLTNKSYRKKQIEKTQGEHL